MLNLKIIFQILTVSFILIDDVALARSSSKNLLSKEGRERALSLSQKKREKKPSGVNILSKEYRRWSAQRRSSGKKKNAKAFAYDQEPQHQEQLHQTSATAASVSAQPMFVSASFSLRVNEGFFTLISNDMLTTNSARAQAVARKADKFAHALAHAPGKTDGSTLGEHDRFHINAVFVRNIVDPLAQGSHPMAARYPTVFDLDHTLAIDPHHFPVDLDRDPSRAPGSRGPTTSNAAAAAMNTPRTPSGSPIRQISPMRPSGRRSSSRVDGYDVIFETNYAVYSLQSGAVLDTLRAEDLARRSDTGSLLNRILPDVASRFGITTAQMKELVFEVHLTGLHVASETTTTTPAPKVPRPTDPDFVSDSSSADPVVQFSFAVFMVVGLVLCAIALLYYFWNDTAGLDLLDDRRPDTPRKKKTLLPTDADVSSSAGEIGMVTFAGMNNYAGSKSRYHDTVQSNKSLWDRPTRFDKSYAAADPRKTAAEGPPRKTGVDPRKTVEPRKTGADEAFKKQKSVNFFGKSEYVSGLDWSYEELSGEGDEPSRSPRVTEASTSGLRSKSVMPSSSASGLDEDRVHRRTSGGGEM